MNIRSNVFYCAAVILPLMLCGCGGGTLLRQGYEGQAKQKNAQKTERKQKEVTHLECGTCDYEQTKSGVTVRAKVLKNEQECVEAFGKNGKYLLNIKKEKRRIHPIKITVKNNSNTELILSKAKIKLASAKKVLAKLGSSNWLKVCGLGAGIYAGSSIIVSIALSILLYPFGPGPSSMSIVLAVTSCWFVAALWLATPFAMVAYKSKLNKPNKKLKKKILASPSIKPSETKTFFLFVRQRDYKQNFELTFTDKNQTKLPFNLQLPAL